ncbi:MAG TPA: RNA 2',3'-cyclic phosphodiesterase [Polyangia bacterium]|jgi:RNA 2',3'-cyclic 3'-phosphodiesterase|nr:RNA 2',3'-cyclic phosphodiesterase [Polyangia bacterium]
MLRLFVAVDLPAELRPAVVRLCQGIGGARWTRPEQLHITLRFLGDTPEDLLGDMRARLRQVRVAGFQLALRRTGVFPPLGGRKPPRVLWLGLDPPEPLQALKQAIDGVLGPDPETAKRDFSPHLTLARFPTRPRHDLDRFLAEHAGFEGGCFAVGNFHLYRSTLRPQGALHELVESFPLA